MQGTRYMARIWRRKRYCKERRQKRDYAVSGGRGDSEYKTSSPVYALYQGVVIIYVDRAKAKGLFFSTISHLFMISFTVESV
jgi:hypothetical protein